jgi:hypothetical protein
VPPQRELAHLAQASNFATSVAKDGTPDFAQLHADWADAGHASSVAISVG